MKRWMVLAVFLVIMGLWVGVPMLGLAVEPGTVRLFAGLALAAFMFGYVPEGDLVETGEPVRLWRRFAAFLADMVALFLVLHPLLSMIHVAAAILAGVALVFSYFWLHPVFGRATLGQYLLGYRIVPAGEVNGEPEYAHRTLSALFALCQFPVTFISASQDDAAPGTYHWDRESHTQAVRVEGLGR